MKKLILPILLSSLPMHAMISEKNTIESSERIRVQLDGFRDDALQFFFCGKKYTLELPYGKLDIDTPLLPELVPPQFKPNPNMTPLQKQLQKQLQEQCMIALKSSPNMISLKSLVDSEYKKAIKSYTQNPDRLPLIVKLAGIDHLLPYTENRSVVHHLTPIEFADKTGHKKAADYLRVHKGLPPKKRIVKRRHKK